MLCKLFKSQADKELDNGRLIKNGDRYTVRYLSHSDIKQSADLQQHVVETLHELGKDHYIIPKSKDKLHKYLNKGDSIIGTFVKRGIFSKDRLAAHMIVSYPNTLEDIGLADNSKLPTKPVSNISVVSNILVHQDFRGNKLMQEMLKQWLQVAISDGKTHAMAEASLENEFSWSVFLDAGFVIYDAGHDPRDKSENVYLHKMLDHEFVYGYKEQDLATIKLFDANNEIDPKAYSDLQDYLKQGFHVLDFDKQSKSLFLAKCIDKKPLPSHSIAHSAPANDP